MDPNIHNFECQSKEMGLLPSNGHFASFHVQFGLFCTLFCHSSHIETELGHKTWPIAKGRSLRTENAKIKFLQECYQWSALFRGLVDNWILLSLQGPFFKDPVINKNQQIDINYCIISTLQHIQQIVITCTYNNFLKIFF